MGFPRCRKLNEDIQYTWDFSILEPLSPITTKTSRRYFDDLKEHPSGRVVGLSSVGTRISDHPSTQLVFPLTLDLNATQTNIIQSFFRDGAFWFFPDSDDPNGHLVTYFPKEFTPEPTDTGRFLITGHLVQLGKQTIVAESPGVSEIENTIVEYQQQHRARSGFSLWVNDKEGIDNNGAIAGANTHAIYVFPEYEAESGTSDWTLLDNHFVRHETNYIDRYDRILFNWVRSIKLRYRLEFNAISEDFMQKIIRFAAQRFGRFYPVVDTRLIDETLTDYILQPFDEGIPFVNVRVIEPELEHNYYNGLYDIVITLEEI